jgi:hypothetical protein
MFKYALLLGVAMPAFAFAADYSTSTSGRGCRIDQGGNRYCVESPIEKRYTDCTAGVDCHHMQSGQHYSQQSPTLSSIAEN